MNEPYIRPDARGFLDMMAQMPRPAMTAEAIAQMRAMPLDQMALMDLPMGELGEVRDVAMPGPGGEIGLRLFDPRAERGPGPVVVFYHGGGYVLGGIDTHVGIAASIARDLDLPVVSVEYRLAPEHQWPAATDDGEAAARWVADNGAAFGREFTALVLAGDSAGGNLTLVVAQALRDRPAALPVILQLPIYPATDSSRAHPSRAELGDGYGLSSEDMGLFEQHYGGDVHDPRRSPLLADLAGLPPTVLVTAALDPLRDEGRAYAAKAIEAGVTTVYYEAAGLIHGFCSYRRLIPSAQADFARVLALAKGLLESS